MKNKIDVAVSPDTPREVLLKISRDRKTEVRNDVARNPSTPVEALLRLAKDRNRDVVLSAARNKNATEKVVLVALKKITGFTDHEINKFHRDYPFGR